MKYLHNETVAFQVADSFVVCIYTEILHIESLRIDITSKTVVNFLKLCWFTSTLRATVNFLGADVTGHVTTRNQHHVHFVVHADTAEVGVLAGFLVSFRVTFQALQTAF